MYLITLIFAPFLIYFLCEVFKRKNFLLNFSGDKHQTFVTKDKVPLCGGIILFLFFSTLFFDELDLLIFIFLILVVGFFSDLKVFVSPKLRFFIQLIFLLFFVFHFDLKLENTKILLIDNLISSQIYNYFFVVFCLLILINGTNFIDGLNTNVLGYYIIISLLVININESFILENFKLWNLWIIFLAIILIFNFFNRLFLGDGGSYVLGLIYGYLLIELYNKTQNLSSLYIVVLLWYPCFELLFSIIRKFKLNRSPIEADTKHFHQLLFLIIKKKYKLSNFKANVLSATFINIYNSVFITIASSYAYNSQYQMMFLILNILVYIYLYFFMFKKNFLRNL